MVRCVRSGAVCTSEDADSGLGGSHVSDAPPSSGAIGAPQASIFGRHMRVTVCANQGGRKYMEDRVQIHCERDPLTNEILWTYFGVYDGHGGSHAAQFAREHLMRNIVANEKFDPERSDQDILKAIESGFLITHDQMNRVVDTWPRTTSGYRSTAGTTASVAIVMRGKLYVGHVGDSAVMLGERNRTGSAHTVGRPIVNYSGRVVTREHKPECPLERGRIERSGGEVMQKANVMRVVWHRNSGGQDGPPGVASERIPFLAVARSLGDLWSYNHMTSEYVVSPTPDTHVIELNETHACMILGSDGLTNVMRPQNAIDIVNAHEWAEQAVRWRAGKPVNLNRSHSNHARWLVRHALRSWSFMRADNITAVAVIFDEPHSSQLTPGKDASPLDIDIDTQLSTAPDSMVCITPCRTLPLPTLPMQLYYAGAVDAPEGGPPVRAHDVSPAALEAAISYRGPGFATYVPEHPSNPYSSSGSPIKPALYSGRQGSFCLRDRDRGSPTKSTANSSENTMPDTSLGTVSSAPALRMAADMLNSAVDKGQDQEPPSDAMSPSKISPISRKRHYPYLDRSPSLAQYRTGPSDVNAQNSNRIQNNSSSMDSYPQQYQCKKHGLGCAKVRRMNRQWAKEMGYRVEESPPPPDPAPSETNFSRVTRHMVKSAKPAPDQDDPDSDQDHELILSPRAKRQPAFYIDSGTEPDGFGGVREQDFEPDGRERFESAGRQDMQRGAARRRGRPNNTPGIKSATKTHRRTELDQLLASTPPTFDVGSTPANTPNTRWSECRKRCLRSAVRGRTPRAKVTPVASRGGKATPGWRGSGSSRGSRAAAKVAANVGGRLWRMRSLRSSTTKNSSKCSRKSFRKVSGNGKSPMQGTLGNRPTSCEPNSGPPLQQGEEFLNTSDPTFNRATQTPTSASGANLVLNGDRYAEVIGSRLNQPTMYTHHRSLKQSARGGGSFTLKRKLSEHFSAPGPSDATFSGANPPPAKKARFPWNFLTNLSKRWQ